MGYLRGFIGTLLGVLICMATLAYAQPNPHVLNQIAETGTAEEQRVIGWLYSRGSMGVEQDDQEAAVWFLRAAEKGDIEAQRTAGLISLMGKGVRENRVVAVDWFKKAAIQGDAISQYMLGSAYFRGMGIPQNFRQSYFWLSLAVAGGIPDAESQRDAAALRLAAEERLSKEDLARVQDETERWKPVVQKLR